MDNSESDYDPNEEFDYSSDEYEVRTDGEEMCDEDEDPFPNIPTNIVSSNNGSQAKSAEEIDSGAPDAIPAFRPEYPPGIRLENVRTRGDRNTLLSAGAFFKLFFDLSVVGEIVKYTNEYAEHMKESKPAMYRDWRPLTCEEFYVFLALLMYMSIVPVCRLYLFWSTQQLFHGLWARAFMSRGRFFQIQSFLKVSNHRTEDRTDKLAKVKFLHEYIRRKCMKFFQPDRNISIDERMVANKGRYSFRQYIRDKPTKWGMKLWVLADSATGYTYNFDVYLGKSERSVFGLAYDVVMLLCRPLVNQGYRLFVDNFYTSVQLFKDLLTKGIVACGTMLCNRRGFPSVLKNIKEFNRKNRGEIRWVREGNLGFVQWKDNKTVNVLTTMHKSVSERGYCERRVKVNGQFMKSVVRQPNVIKDYNAYMGGVDKSDQMIGKYKLLRRTSKFWKTLMYHYIDIAKVNSFILFQEFRKKNPKISQLVRPVGFDQLFFTVELIKELGKIAPDMSVPLYEVKKLSVSVSDHYVSPCPSDVRRNCFRCYRIHKIQRKTTVKCSVCDKHFCFNKLRNCLKLEHL